MSIRALATLEGLRTRLGEELAKATQAQTEATTARRTATTRMTELATEIEDLDAAIGAVRALDEDPPS